MEDFLSLHGIMRPNTSGGDSDGTKEASIPSTPSTSRREKPPGGLDSASSSVGGRSVTGAKRTSKFVRSDALRADI